MAKKEDKNKKHKDKAELGKEIGYVKPREIKQEMEESYIDYAMSVIVSRALPDVRDGLKPVHRRILYAMLEQGLYHNSKFRKSANVVGECFVKDTLILSKKGLIPIQEIRVGDGVYTQKGIERVVKLYKMPKKPLLKVKLDNGLSNIVTPSQKFKTLTQDWNFVWKEAKELTKDDFVVARTHYPDIGNLVKLKRIDKSQPQYLNKNIAYLLGIFLADGSISNDYSRKKLPRICFCLGDEPGIADRIASIFEKEFGYLPKAEVHRYKYQNNKGDVFNNKQYFLRINRKDINEFFVRNFSISGVNAYTKRIPMEIFRSPAEVIFSLISGMIDGDGHIHKNKPYVNYGSISEELIDGLMLLLHHQGFIASKYILKPSKGGFINQRLVMARHDPYALELGGKAAVRFIKLLNLASKKKSARVQKYIANEGDRRDCGFSHDIIPYAGEILFGELSREHLGGGWYEDGDGIKFREGIKHRAGCKIRYSSDLWDKSLRKTQVVDWGIMDKIEKIGSPLFGFLEHIIKNKIYFLKVSSIEKVKAQETYDFEVENEHEFIANGIVSHNCLGHYHPHSDQAVYDSLVRMAQDFSLRYLLVKGQGNFGCFTGDTEIRLCDGGSINFKKLIKEQKEGKRHWTFSFNHQSKKVEVAEISSPRLTRKKEKIIEITIDNGEKIKCTLDHKFLLKNGKYKEAENLKIGDSLMPVYIKSCEGTEKLNLKDYRMVYQPKEESWAFIHRLADEWNLAQGVYDKSAGRIRHHKDFDKLNNNPINIERIPWGKHWQKHKEIASLRHKENPAYVKKLAEGRQKFWANPENRKIYSERLSQRNKEMWQSPKYRKLWIEARKEMWRNPDYKEFMRTQSSKNLKRLWQTKEFPKLMSDLKSNEIEKRWENEEYRNQMAKHMKEISVKLWSNPEHREHISKLMKKKFQDPAMREKLSHRMKKLWEDPEFRKKYPVAHFKKMAKISWENPKIHELHNQKTKEQWEDPDFRKKFINGVISANRKCIEENPEYMNELADKARVSLKQKWRDPDYKKRVMRSKVLGYVKKLLDENVKVTPDLYEKERVNNGIPTLENALNYFNDFPEILEESQFYNHKVVSIKLLSNKEDVYDITVDPHHNFALASGVFVHNSVDGDPSASMRYTEVKLTALSEQMLLDIKKETVDFMDNYDGSRQEPVVLPALPPQLLLNGSLGIAVGMATNIPPHNLSEVCDAAIYMLDNPQAKTEDLFAFIKGPDFPTAGIIYDQKEIISAYSQGRGPILIRGKADIEETKNDGWRIVITEIPYQVQKSSLVTQIAKLIQDKKIKGIKDARDESDRDGMRIIMELKKEAFPQKILNYLYKTTDLQKKFHLNMIALVDGIQPRTLSLPEVIHYYLEHRKDVVVRRVKYELKKSKEREHILEGLAKCLSKIDQVIQTIKKADDREDAKVKLKKQFKLTDIQAEAILETKLSALAKLERKKIEDELNQIKLNIRDLQAILKSKQKVKAVIKKELKKLKEDFGDERRTKVFVKKVDDISVEDLVAEEETLITLTNNGYIKRMSPTVYKTQHRGGKGIIGMKTRDEDFIKHFLLANTLDNILFFTDSGKVFLVPAHELPQGNRTANGKALVNFLEITPNDKVLAILPLGKEDEEKKIEHLVMATQNGIIKKTKLKDFDNIRKSGLIAIRLKKDDLLCSVKRTSGKSEIILITEKAQSIRFKESDIRPMQRNAAGNKGIRLKKDDKVIGMEVIEKANEKDYLLVISENGYGKKTKLGNYRKQSRGGTGIKTAELTQRTGALVRTEILKGQEDLIIISKKGQVIRTTAKSISSLGRATQGVRIMNLSKEDKIMSLIRI